MGAGEKQWALEPIRPFSRELEVSNVLCPPLKQLAHETGSLYGEQQVGMGRWGLPVSKGEEPSKRKWSGFEKEHVSMLRDTRAEGVSDLNAKLCPLAPPPAWVHHAGWWGFLQGQFRYI